MRVARIEAFGFKSFMERLVLPLEAGITGIVGPNGCGKSNVIDALRWVLGETKASNLRGEVLEDVLFNGTDKLRPLGLAEVTITLKSTKPNFFADLVSPELEAAEIANSPKLLPPATLEESPQQGEQSSALSTEEISEAAPIVPFERPALTVIEGMLGKNQFTSNEGPEDELLPTAENSILTVESETAELLSTHRDGTDGDEPAAAQSNSRVTMLTRFAWLKSVSEVQVTRRLYRSGESEFFINRVACRLKDLRDFFRAVGLGARSHTIIAQGEISRIVTSKPQERRLILEEAAGVLGFRDKIASAERRLEDTKLNIARILDIEKEVGRQVNSLKRQAARAEARDELKARIRHLDQALYEDKLRVMLDRLEGIESGKAGREQADTVTEKELAAFFSEEQSQREIMFSADAKVDGVRTQVNQLERSLIERERSRDAVRSRIRELGSLIGARENEVKRLAERGEQLSQRQAACTRDLEQFKLKEAVALQAVSETEALGALDLEKISQELTRLREELRQKESQIREVRDELISRKSSLRAIADQLTAASPEEQLRRGLGKAAQIAGAEVQRTLGTTVRLFVDGLVVAQEYTRAVQAVLAEKAQFLMSTDPHAIGRAFVTGLERAGGQGKEQRIGLGAFRLSGTETQAFEAEVGAVPFPTLLSRIEVLPECREIAARMFRNVHVVPSTAAAFEFFAQKSGAFFDTVLVTSDGDVVTQDSFYSLRHEGGLVVLKNRSREIESELATLNTRHDDAVKIRDALTVKVKETEEEQRRALREHQLRQEKLRSLSQELSSARGRLSGEQRILKQVQDDLQSLEGLLREAKQKSEEYGTLKVGAEQELATLVGADDSRLQGELLALKEILSAHEKERLAVRENLLSLSKKVDGARRAHEKARAQLSQGTLDLQRVSLEIESLHERIVSDLGAEVLAILREKPRENLLRCSAEERERDSQESQSIKARIMREGEVDPSSIEQHRLERARLDELETQRKDLESAQATLQITIERLTETSQERFLATFTAVRKNFQELVPRLFGGGKGDIELTTPDQPLDSGIEIIARPPGKKLNNIELMSGGEKAMCATALVFAMFLEKPSPLCVLDEVDAPLDEANVVRFLTLMTEMSKNTQFLMITHNKQSMAAADHLVGVTMQEPGATRVVSVSLQEAFTQVA